MGPGRCIATHPGNMYTEPWVGVKVKVGDETDEYPFWTRTATLPSGEFEKCTAPPTASSDSSVSTAVSVGLPRVPSKASACHSQRSTSPPAVNLLTCSTHGLVYIVSPVFCAYCAATASKIDRSCGGKRSGFVEPSPTASLALYRCCSAHAPTWSSCSDVVPKTWGVTVKTARPTGCILPTRRLAPRVLALEPILFSQKTPAAAPALRPRP